MADSFLRFPIGTQRFSGYTSDPSNASADYVSFPCQDMIITDDGKIEKRLGYREEFTIGVAGAEPTSFYMSAYDATFFALGTKVYYYDHAVEASYDTGITLTSGTTTRFAELFGDLYLSNTTDGVYRIMVSRVNGAVASGAATITLDADGAARLSAFGDTSGNIRISGVNESFASLVIATGVLTHSTTTSQAYADNAIAIFIDRYSSLEKASKIVFFKARMHLLGFPNPTNTDAPNNSVITSQFILNNIQEMEKIVDFTFGTGGSTRITVSGGGKVTNTLSVGDSIYFFTQEKVFATSAGNISDSGASIGLTIPVEKDTLHGCLNEDSATVMGSGALTYITNDKRIISLPVDTESGAAIAAPQEDFDRDVRGILKDMDDVQPNAFAYHFRGGRKTIYQVRVKGQYIWLIFDHNIVREMGSNFVRGAWQPPQYVTPMNSLFERNGTLYGTTDNTVYSIFTSFTDNLIPIRAIFATGEFNVGNAMVKRAELQGLINQPAEIRIKCYVTNENGGKRSGSEKLVSGSAYTYSDDFSVGALPVGSGGTGETTNVARWKKGFGVFPSEATVAQIIIEDFEDGGYFSINSFLLDGTQFPRTFSKYL